MSNNNPYPVPQNPEWPGYVGPVTIGQTEYGMSKAGSAVASVGTTLAATAAFALAGAESPVGLNVDATYHETHRVVVDRNSQTTHNPAVPQWMKAEKNGTRVVTGTETKALENFSFMPSPQSFDLDRVPGAQVISNKADLERFVLDIKRSQAEGWTVTGIYRDGRSSDDTRQDAQFGMHKHDSGNERLAVQYGAFVDRAFDSEAAKQGVNLSGVERINTSREVVVEGELRKHWDKTLAELGYTNEAEFIAAYKNNPAGMSVAARNAAAFFFDANHGAKQVVRLTRPSQWEVPRYEETRATRCVDETVVHLTTEDRVTEYGGNLPIVPVFLPVIRRRRKEDFLDGPFVDVPTADADDQPSVVDGEVLPDDSTKADARQEASAADASSDTTETKLPSWAYRVGGKSRRVRKDRSPREDRPPKPRRKEIWEVDFSNPEEMDAYFQQRRRERWADIRAGGITLAAAAAVLSCLRLDAGYCPDPENWEKQSWSISRPIPDSLHVGLGLPFFIPGPETGKVGFLPPVCPAEDRGAPYSDGDGRNGGNSEPSCDTKVTTITNGQVTKVTETHYPGAITITKTER